ncbi:hypothetical protein ACFQU2_36540 [Siccirubricoccus deserti]
MAAGACALRPCPASLVIVRAERWPDALWAMEEALRCPAVTGALLALALLPAAASWT